MQVVLFDIDGTLITTGGAGKLAFERAFAELFDISRIDGQVQFSGRTDRAIVTELFLIHGIADSTENWRRFLAAYFAHLPEMLRACAGAVLPGIAQVLAHLADRPETSVGLLTGNVREGGMLKLAHYGIDHHFPFGGFGDAHIDRAKVAAAAVRAACGHLNRADDRLRFWVIGDTPHDVYCGHSIGAKVVGVATGTSPSGELIAAGAELVLEDLSDPAPLWAALAP
jgi:phosphoglycolate phosphatase-like HAD superfamily hydrolase